jgi:hypothetical protein
MQSGRCTERGRARHMFSADPSLDFGVRGIWPCSTAGTGFRRCAAALPSVAALTGMPCLWSTFAQNPIVRFDYAEVAE